MHVELVETKKREDRKISRKPFLYKEIDFPTISSEKSKERKHSNGIFFIIAKN